MSVSVKRLLNSPLMVGACMTTVITVTGTVYALFYPRSPQAIANADPALQATNCKTVVFDPEPPLNVRSEPIEQSGNIIGKLPNGEVLSVVGKANGWVKINAPMVGWVYQNLTKESCDGTPVAVLTPKPPLPDARLAPPNDKGSRLYAEAEFHFQQGNLKGAIALAKAVPKDSLAYDQAQTALNMMPKIWKQAQAKYHTAKQAGKDNQWNEVLVIAKDFPDIRFWREQLAPIVRQAIQRKYNHSTNEVQ
jgi:hypothetical protein